MFSPLSEQASQVTEITESVKAALEETARAHGVAADTIQLVQNNTRGTVDLLQSVSLSGRLDT